MPASPCGKLTQLGVDNDQLFGCSLGLLLFDLAREELLEALAHLALSNLAGVLDGLGGRGESMDGMEGEEAARLGWVGKVLVEVIRADLCDGGVQPEEAEAHCCFEQDEDHGVVEL